MAFYCLNLRKGIIFFRKTCISLEKLLSLQPKSLVSAFFCYTDLDLGLTGFDSGLRWYVSTRRLVGSLHNPRQQKINWQQ